MLVLEEEAPHVIHHQVLNLQRITNAATQTESEYVAVVSAHVAIPTLLFYCPCRTPERPSWIDPIRIEIQHLVVKLLGGCRDYGHSVEITYVLSGLLDDSWIIVITRS